jgi:hypothetical protein
MATSRSYFVDSLGVSIGGTSATPILYIAPTSSNDLNVCRIRCSVEAASSPAPPSNGSVLFQLVKVTGTKGGGGAVTPAQLSGATLAANTVFASANAAALTGLTASTEYWAHPVPFAAGASWEDSFENTGFERYIPASGIYAVYFTAASGAGSGCNARVTLDFSE